MRRRIPATIALAVSALAVAACGPATSSASSSATTPAAASASAAATLGPLALGSFPATTDGRLAKSICSSWAGLRSEYATRVATDTPFQLNQWFSSPAWGTIQSDALKLPAEGAYVPITAALGVVFNGDTASIANARNLDRACAAG